MRVNEALVFITVCLAMLVGVVHASGIAYASNGTTIELWYGEGHGELYDQTFQRIINRFEEENPGIKVNIDFRGHPNSWHDQLLVAIMGGMPPDVAYIDARAAHELRLNGLLTPLNAHFERIAPEAMAAMDTASWIPNAPLEYSHQGIFYGIPFRTDIRGMYVNVDLMENAGVDALVAPRTIADLDLLSDKLTRLDGAGNVAVVGFLPWGNMIELYWMDAMGGQSFDWENFRLTLTEHPQNITAVEWILGYAERYDISNPNYGEAWFVDERQAMHVTSTTRLELFPEKAPDLNWWTHPLPYDPGGKNPTHSSVLGPMIPQGAQNLDAAVKLLAFLSRPEIQLEWYKNTQSLPARVEALNQIGREGLIDDPRAMNLIQQWPETNARLPLKPELRNGEMGWRTLLRPLVRREITPIQYLENVQMFNMKYEEAFGSQ